MNKTTYPDIFDFVTAGTRTQVNHVDVALAIAPPVVRAGRPFQALLLAQNTSDAHVDLNAVLNLPGRKSRFVAAAETLDYRLRPGEAGYFSLPIKSHPETAPDNNYKLGVAVTARPLTNPTPVRATGEGPALTSLSQQRQTTIAKLRQLKWSTSKRFGLRDALEVSFQVGPAQSSATSTIKPGWQSLWNLAADGTPRMLLDHYADLLQQRVFPRLKKDAMFVPLMQATAERFKKAGYPLKPEEILLISKLLTLVVHMSDPGEDNIDYLGSQEFNVRVLFNHDLPPTVRFPRWFDVLLREIAANEQVATRPAQIVSDKAYTALVRDTLPFAFAMIAKVTGEDLGTEAEIASYSDSFIAQLDKTDGMDFGRVYLPLIMGGAIVFDRVIAPEEVLEDTLRGMSQVLADRDAEWTEANDLVFLMTKDLINRSLRLFGFQI